MGQIQTASGTGRPEGNSLLQEQFRTFAAGADVQRQRLDAYDDQYAEVSFKGTQKAMCLPCGGELHLQDAGVVPVAPYDWVVELPDGTMGSLSAEQVADHMEFVSGPDEQREAFERTVEHVENGRKAPGANVNLAVEPTTMPHPDGFDAIDAEFDRRAQENIVANLQRQAEDARSTLTALAGVAVKRGTITKPESEEWIDTGVAPEGVSVRFDAGLNSYEVTRAPAPTTPTTGGATAVSDPDVETDGHDRGDIGSTPAAKPSAS